MSYDKQLPPFIVESFDDDSQFSQEGQIELAEALSALGESADLPPAADLLGRLESAPIKYAPFFGRVAQMFGLKENEVEALLVDTGWKKAPIPGLELKEVEAAKLPPHQSASLVRFREGMSYPKHGHDSLERVLILEGGYTDAGGNHYEAGDLHEMPPGTEHSFVVDHGGPCVAAAVADKKVRFSAWWLRLLGALIGR